MPRKPKQPDPDLAPAAPAEPLLVAHAEGRRLLGDVSHSFYYDLIADGIIEVVRLRGRSFSTMESVKRAAASGTGAGVGPRGGRRPRKSAATSTPPDTPPVPLHAGRRE